MSIDTTRQLVILIYEYFYFNGARLEKEYIEMLDRYYWSMFQRFPEKHINDYELLQIIKKKYEIEEFRKVQDDIYRLLKFYNTASDPEGNNHS